MPVAVLPFSSEAAVATDLRDARYFTCPSRSTLSMKISSTSVCPPKLVTYLGSGLPILYHGPRHGAAYRLLSDHGAAIVAASLDPAAVADAIANGLQDVAGIVTNARRLAAEQFTLERQRDVFWSRHPVVARCSSSAEVSA